MLKKVLKLFLIASLVLLVGVRFLWLSEFPVGVLHDEIDVVLSAKTYWVNGTDLSGVVFPKSLFVTNTWAFLSGLPSFLMAPVYGLIDLNPGSIRIPYQLLSLLTIFIIYKFVDNLTKDKFLSRATVLFALLSPWLFFYGRQPTESPFSLIFGLLSVYFLFNKDSVKDYLLSGTFFVLGFFSYFGAKPVFPFLFVLLLIYKTTLKNFKFDKQLRINSPKNGLFLGLILLIVPIYLFISHSFPGNTLDQRNGQLTFMNLDNYSSTVNDQRRQSIFFNGKDLFLNKYTELVRDGAKKYLAAFSPEFLFLKGDGMYTLNEHGALYLLDILFILVAFMAYGYLKPGHQKLILISILFLISGAVGSAISTWPNQYVYRSFLHIPAYILLISIGFSYLYKIVKYKYQPFFVILVGFLYLLLFTNYLVIFFFRYSVSEQSHHFLSERVLSGYLNRVEKKDKILVVTAEPDRIYYQYVFYANDLSDLKYLKGHQKEQLINLENIEFTNNCPDDIGQNLVILDPKLGCKDIPDISFAAIQNHKDAGVDYKIYGDLLCNNYELDKYRRQHLISDYNIERMSDQDFCLRWIQNGKNN